MKTKPNPFHKPAMIRDPISGELKEKLDTENEIKNQSPPLVTPPLEGTGEAKGDK